jgi:tellurite resistance protein TerC
MLPPHAHQAPTWFWWVFNAFILVLLAVDLGVFQRRPHDMGKGEAAGRVGAMVALALLFDAWVFFAWDRTKGLEFLAGYVIEYSLSVDNVFVFIVILNYFHVKRAYQHAVLFWGILGALVMRGAFILAGTALFRQFEWVSYVFGAFLVFTGARLMLVDEYHVHPERNPVVRFFRRIMPMTSDYRGGRFGVVENGRWLATPLLLVLVAVDVIDLVFAVDSIPAVFAVSRDPFIIYTSNVFAILGLRALYFLVAGVMDELKHLKLGLALVLVFVGLKMTFERLVHVPITLSLAVVGGILALATLASIVAQRRGRPGQGGGPA